MKRNFKLVECIILLSCILFSASCQKKQLVTTPLTVQSPKQVISNSDWVEEEKGEVIDAEDLINPEKKSNHVDDPYKELVERGVFLRRYYKDLNGDNIPELFLPCNLGSSSVTYLMYRITKNGYDFIGKANFLFFQLLPAKHYGYFDFQGFVQSFTKEGSYHVGGLYLYVFDGITYKENKTIDYIYNENNHDQVFNPIQLDEDLKPPNTWSPKDDDKYRRMIK